MAPNKMFRPWSPTEDKIISFLRKDVYSIKDISKGLFHRSRSATAGRISILRRYERGI